MTKTVDPVTLAVEMWDTEALVPYPRNAKMHPDEQITRLAATIKRFGWDQPIVVDTDGVIIKGHGRRLAAIKLELKRVPVLVRRDLTKSEADAVRISDNAVFGMSFDTRMLQDELGRLMADAEVSFGVDDLGLSSKDHDLLMKQLDVAAAGVLMTDTHGEIERAKDEDARAVEASDKEDVSISEAFGFKRMTREDSRLVQRFVAHAEEVTGKESGQAVIGWMREQARGGVL